MNRFLQYYNRNQRRRFDGGGMMPDPSMMGEAPGGMPGGGQINPAMLQQLLAANGGGGGVPGMDPSMMGGAPGGGQMDPAMLQQLMAAAGGGGGAPRKDLAMMDGVPNDMEGEAPEQIGGINAVSNIEEGGTHEENPLEGVPVGHDEEGIQNLVEEGEVIYKDFVFSDRIEVDADMIEPFNLPANFKGLTYAEAAKKLQEEAKERPNDMISQRGLDASMGNLQAAQETQKLREDMREEKEIRDNESQETDELGSSIQKSPEEQEELQAQDDALEELENNPRGFAEDQANAANEISPEDAEAQELAALQEGAGLPAGLDQQQTAQEQAMDPSAMGLMARGGRLRNRYDNGGGININPKNEGKFTQAAKSAGMNTQVYANYILAHKDKYSPTLVKRANFARNAKKWNALGGRLFGVGGTGTFGNKNFGEALMKINDKSMTEGPKIMQAYAGGKSGALAAGAGNNDNSMWQNMGAWFKGNNEFKQQPITTTTNSNAYGGSLGCQIPSRKNVFWGGGQRKLGFNDEDAKKVTINDDEIEKILAGKRNLRKSMRAFYNENAIDNADNKRVLPSINSLSPEKQKEYNALKEEYDRYNAAVARKHALEEEQAKDDIVNRNQRHQNGIEIGMRSGQLATLIGNAYSAHKNANYSTANAMENAANAQLGYSGAGYSPVTTRMQYNNIDPWYVMNQQISQGNANDAALRSMYRGNRGAIANAILANRYNTQRAMSEAAVQGAQANAALAAQAAQINQATESANAQMGLQSSQANAQIRQNALAKYADMMRAAATHRRSIWSDREDAINASRAALANWYGDYAKDLYESNLANLNGKYGYYITPSGDVYYQGKKVEDPTKNNNQQG